MKVALQTFRLFLALVTIPFVKTQVADCGSTLVGTALDCCGDLCCPPISAVGCPLESCAVNTCAAGGVNVDVDCIYDEPVCDDDQPFDPATCLCGCTNDDDCTGLPNLPLRCPFCNIGTGRCSENPCPGSFLNPNACVCGCLVSVDCIGNVPPFSCPTCDAQTGVCSSQDCGDNQPCCKATSGNDLVCSSGCGQGNVCFQNDVNGICDGTALCIANEFSGNDPEQVELCLDAQACLMLAPRPKRLCLANLPL